MGWQWFGRPGSGSYKLTLQVSRRRSAPENQKGRRGRAPLKVKRPFGKPPKRQDRRTTGRGERKRRGLCVPAQSLQIEPGPTSRRRLETVGAFAQCKGVTDVPQIVTA